jgi:hypothetical protein
VEEVIKQLCTYASLYVYLSPYCQFICISTLSIFSEILLVRYLKRKSISLCSYYLTFHWLKDRFPSLFALEILNRTSNRRTTGLTSRNWYCIFLVEAGLHRFFFLLFYICITVGDPIINRGWYPINRFNPATFVCLSQARTWISNVICRGLFYVQ